jgi:hypothetical protein
MGGTRAISKASFGRTARFGNCLPVLSQLAALEGRLSRQGTKSDAQVYVLHSPSFWALAFIAFGIVFFLFRIP